MKEYTVIGLMTEEEDFLVAGVIEGWGLTVTGTSLSPGYDRFVFEVVAYHFEDAEAMAIDEFHYDPLSGRV